MLNTEALLYPSCFPSFYSFFCHRHFSFSHKIYVLQELVAVVVMVLPCKLRWGYMEGEKSQGPLGMTLEGSFSVLLSNLPVVALPATFHLRLFKGLVGSLDTLLNHLSPSLPPSREPSSFSYSFDIFLIALAIYLGELWAFTTMHLMYCSSISSSPSVPQDGHWDTGCPLTSLQG